jgi:hypothetical protein
MINREPLPIRVRFLLILLLFFTLWNMLRFGEALYFWKSLLEYGARPMYIAITGAAWFLIGSFLLWRIWSKKSGAWLVTVIYVAAYAAWYWIDRLFVQKPHTNAPFALISTIILILISLLILFSRRTREFFS